MPDLTLDPQRTAVLCMDYQAAIVANFAAGAEELAEMADVRGHAGQLLRYVASLHDDGNCLKEPLAIELRTGGRD